jgi:hypothetical protein
MDFGLHPVEVKSEADSICPNRTDIWGKPKSFYFSPPRGKMNTGDQGGVSTTGDGGRLYQ